MDISKLRPVRISPSAREKVMLDFYPELGSSAGVFYADKTFDDRSQAMHAGALCLYATTLTTKIHETNPFDLEPYFKEREESYKTLIKNHPKHALLSDEQVATFARNLIERDIRNSFAHGNFEISYDVYTKKLYFVLQPQRKDFVTSEPIVISKQALLNVNKKFLHEKGRTYSYYPDILIDGEITHHLDRALKGFMLPMQMFNLARFYLDGSVKRKSDIMFQDKMYHVIQYSLLASKITYDQNDYYSIFGKSSNVFDTISLVRNSLAHDNVTFIDNAQNVSYVDGERAVSESVGLSASKLLIVDMQKQMLMNLNGKTRQENISDLTERCKEIFDFFFDGTYDFEELINCIAEDAEEMQ